jgi:diguanylate cyclase (GGDEF)-like protein
LDDFKGINDTLGHSMGDRFLIAMAERLKETFRADDEFFRIGGDEFLVYAQNYGNGRHIVTIAEKLQKALSTPVLIDEHQLQASGSIGIVLVPRDAQNYEHAVKRADIAMYRAKEEGKNCFHFYNEEMEAELLKQYELESSIRKGLDREEFSVFFQPIVDLETGDYVGGEALLRWKHEELGMVPPDVFIPIAEKSSCIDELCKFVISKAQDLIESLPARYPDFYISVNLSAVQVSRKDIEDELFCCIPDNIRKRLKMEMTESQIIENIDIYEENVRSMKEQGMGIFLDDFGTGYSNLGYLQRLKFDTVKIDKSFTRNIHSELEKQPVIRAISNMAREMGMTVVAEGVENEAELVALRNLKIAYGQGYYWSKPVPKEEFLKKI